MAYTNPVMDIMKSDTSAESFAGASRSLQSANQSFQNSASIALKMDQLLKEEESRLHNRAMQSQKMVGDMINSRISQGFQQQQLQFQREQAKIKEDQFNKNFKLNQDQSEIQNKNYEQAKEIGIFNAKQTINANNNKVITDVATLGNKVTSNPNLKQYKAEVDTLNELHEKLVVVDKTGTKNPTLESKTILNEMIKVYEKIKAGGAPSSVLSFADLLINGINRNQVKLPGSEETVTQFSLNPDLYTAAGGITTAPTSLKTTTEPSVVTKPNTTTKSSVKEQEDLVQPTSTAPTALTTDSVKLEPYVERTIFEDKVPYSSSVELMEQSQKQKLSDAIYNNNKKVPLTIDNTKALELVNKALPRGFKIIDSFNYNAIKGNKSYLRKDSHELKPGVLLDGLSLNLTGKQTRDFMRRYYKGDYSKEYKENLREVITNSPLLFKKVLGLDAHGILNTSEKELYDVVQFITSATNTKKETKDLIKTLKQSSSFGEKAFLSSQINHLLRKVDNIYGDSGVYSSETFNKYISDVSDFKTSNTILGKVTRSIFGEGFTKWIDSSFIEDKINIVRTKEDIENLAVTAETKGKYNLSIGIRDWPEFGGLTKTQFIGAKVVDTDLTTSMEPIADIVTNWPKYKIQNQYEKNRNIYEKNYDRTPSKTPVKKTRDYRTNFDDRLSHKSARAKQFEKIMKNKEFKKQVMSGIKKICNEYAHNEVTNNPALTYTFITEGKKITISPDEVAKLNTTIVFSVMQDITEKIQ